MGWQVLRELGQRRVYVGIRGKLVLTLLVSSVPGLLLLGFYAAGVLEDSERVHLADQLANQGGAVAREMEETLAFAAGDVMHIARSPAVRRFAMARKSGGSSAEALELRDTALGEVAVVAEVHQVCVGVSVAGLDGHEWMRVDYGPASAQAHAAPDDQLRDLSDEDYITAAKELPVGVPLVSGPRPDVAADAASGPRAVLIYVAPVGQPGEQPLALVVSRVSVEAIARPAKTRGTWLVDGAGRFVVDPGRAGPGLAPGRDGDLGSLRDVLSPAGFATLSGAGSVTDRGMILVSTPIRVSQPGGAWSVVVVADERDAEAAIRLRLAPARYWLIVVAAVGFLGPVLAAYILSSFFIRAVPRLRRAAQAVAGGDFSHRVTIRSRDEMEELARDFNAMAARLEELGRLEHALALEKLKDDLIHMIVHDLRTPLTSILGGLQTVEHSSFDPVVTRELVPVAISASQTLMMMINDLLDINRMEGGVPTLDVEDVDVAHVCRQAIDMVAGLAADGELELACDASDGVSAIRGDQEKIRRIATNLLGNAVKFTPPGGKVTISVHEERNSPGVHIMVSDTGEGIPAEYRERIFEKFGQVETRKARRMVSTGLGLTFCKMAAEAHGGKIWVESEVGVGSVFHVMLPRDLACPISQDVEGCIPE